MNIDDRKLYELVMRVGMNPGDFKIMSNNQMGIICSKQQLIDFANIIMNQVKDKNGK